ncbi:MAG TPA: TlpA disulfide reductase family protein [Nitrospiria bacterium]|nr:TlpA disulfide reductase family protein [Nitrospiria bacterium]
MRASVYPVTISIGLALLLVSCQQASTQAGATAIATEEAPRIGYLAPNFRLTNLHGEEVSVASLEGKVVFINFWATWCGPCRAEMPSMEALYHDFKDQGLEILAVSSDMDGASAVQPFIRKLGLSYPILLDPDFRVDDKYLIQSVPTTILVDKKGVITHRLVGGRNWSNPESRDLIEKLLKDK